MKKQRTVKIISLTMGLALAVSASATLLTACGSKSFDNEKTPLTLSSESLDTVFNPFFYTAGADGEIVGMTQIGLLTSDKNGQIVSGEDEFCAALAHSVVTTGTKNDITSEAGDAAYANYYTDYYIALKDDVYFSDGERLTMRDVLFNMYMYLDPTYTGSATMYSVAIKGLKAYRTQSLDADDQDGFDAMFDVPAQARISTILEWANDETSTWDDLKYYLVESGDGVESAQDDVKKAHELFRQELETDWNTAQNADLKEYEKYKKADGSNYFTANWQIFLFNYGLITATANRMPNGNGGYTTTYTMSENYDTNMSTEKDELVNYVWLSMLGDYEAATDEYKSNLADIILYYATANNLYQYLVSDEISKKFQGELAVKSISGITTTTGTSIPSADGGTIDLGKECEILKIRINGVDPKAIQNFSFTVAPAHYYVGGYKNGALLNAYDGEEHFCVEFANTEFMDHIRYIQVPRGAGPYRATTAKGSNDTDTIAKGSFFSNNIVYFERNEHFVMGAPKIKYLRYKVTPTSQLYDIIKTGDILYGSPTATKEMKDNLDGVDSKKLDYTLTQNLGYGYIGVSAKYIPNLAIRRAIMYAMDTSLCVQYYGSNDLAEIIYRPMSKTLTDYYPNDATSYYPYDSTGNTSLLLAQEAGYDIRDNSGYLKNSNMETLKYTFTIAGDSSDHPAMTCLENAANILNNIGFDIEVKTDSTALSKLSSGQLQVWAAAWSSSSDPDMYQVYHKDSSATSILAWGFPSIETDTVNDRSEELDLLEDLAGKIEAGRETIIKEERYQAYSSTGGALDIVMELAVELPTYQRRALYVYRQDLFDEATLELFEESTAFQSPLSKIWLVSFA